MTMHLFIFNIFKCLKNFSKNVSKAIFLNILFVRLNSEYIKNSCNKNWLNLESGQRTRIDISKEDTEVANRHIKSVINHKTNRNPNHKLLP